MNYKVTIVMPIYNREFLAIRSTKSVINQTYKNFELLIMNIGLNNKINMLKQIIRSDNRIKIYDVADVDAAIAKNKGIERATGEYIVFLNYNDIFKPTKIEEELKYMMDNDYKFCHTSYDRIDNKGNYIETVYLAELAGDVTEKLIYKSKIELSTVMIKIDIIKASRFISQYGKSQDICFLMDISYTNKLGYLENPLSEIVLNNESKPLLEVETSQIEESVAAHILAVPKYNLYRKYLKKKLKTIEDDKKSKVDTSNLEDQGYDKKLGKNEYANKNKKIVVDIPFNIDIAEHFKNNTYIYQKVKMLFQESQKKEWIRRRIELFMKYTAKSLISQTNQRFIAVVRCTKNTLETINIILKEYDKLPDNIIFTDKAQEILDNQIEEFGMLYRVVINSDNMYSDRFIEMVDYMSVANDTKILICQMGYIYDEKTNKIAEFNQKSSSFYVEIYDKKTYTTIYPLKVYEECIETMDYAYEVIAGKQFCICVHEQNLKNNFEEMVKAFNGVYMEGETKDEILKQLHIKEDVM